MISPGLSSLLQALVESLPLGCSLPTLREFERSLAHIDAMVGMVGKGYEHDHRYKDAKAFVAEMESKYK